MLPTPPGDALHDIRTKFPNEAFYAYASSNARFGQFGDLFSEGSGFLSRIHKNHPELFSTSGKIIDFDKYFEVINKEGKIDIESTQQHIEEKVKESGKPISASAVLTYFLEKNIGSLEQSIYDTAIFLKFMSRNDPQTGDNNPNEFNEKWISQNIKDEYQGPSYINPVGGERVINLIGKPYHSWNLVALLQFFPVELIQAAGIYRQAIFFKDQGLGKTRADLQTLAELRKIEQELLKYSVN